MLIDNRKSPFLQQSPSSSEAQIDSAGVETEVIVLKSGDRALSVIKKLRLNEDPEFIGSDFESLAGLPIQSRNFCNQKTAVNPIRKTASQRQS